MKRKPKYEKAVTLTLFAAIIAVLQVISTFVKFGPFNITLALAPIIIVGALYGVGGGTAMGFVLSLVIFIMGVTGADGGGVLGLMALNPWATVAVIFVKTTLAGFLASLVYRLIAKKNDVVATVVAGIVCPVVNTALYLAGMALFFTDLVIQGAVTEGMGTVTYLFMGMAGINFPIELGVNLVLSAAIVQVVRIVSKQKG